MVDTSVLIGALTGNRSMLPALLRRVEHGELLVLPALVLYEWFRGPRLLEEIAYQERLLPAATALPFGAEQAAIAARLYGQVRRPRTREMDIAIAACAIHSQAALWTLNRADFADIPGLRLADAP